MRICISLSIMLAGECFTRIVEKILSLKETRDFFGPRLKTEGIYKNHLRPSRGHRKNGAYENPDFFHEVGDK